MQVARAREVFYSLARIGTDRSAVAVHENCLSAGRAKIHGQQDRARHSFGAPWISPSALRRAQAIDFRAESQAIHRSVPLDAGLRETTLLQFHRWRLSGRRLERSSRNGD